MKTDEINRQIARLRKTLKRGMAAADGGEPWPTRLGRMEGCISVALIQLDSLDREIHNAAWEPEVTA